MKRTICLAIIALCAACKKDETTETKSNTHTIYHEATIESEGDAAFTAIDYEKYVESSALPTYIVIPGLASKHWISDTMKFTVEEPNLFIWSQYVVTASSAKEGILTIKTFIDGVEVAVSKDTGTVMEATNYFKHSFE
jgi:hypothetical protein